MLPTTQQLPNPQVLFWPAPTKAPRVRSVAKKWTCNSTIVVAAGVEVELTAGMRQWPDASKT